MKGLSSLGGIFNGISSWFAALQPREKVIVSAGAAIVLLAAIYTMLLPGMEKSAELQQRYQTLQADLQWLRDQSATASRLGNSCVEKRISRASHSDVITRTVRRNQLKLLNLSEQGSMKYQLSIEGANANRILQLAHQLACQGLTIRNLQITAESDAEESGRETNSPASARKNITAQLEVQHVK